MKPAGFDIGSLTVISTQEPTSYLASVGAQFVAALEPTRISGDVALNVPGLGATQPYAYGAADSSPALEALSDLGVPDGRSDDFLAAVDSGRCVAGCTATDNVETLKALFSAAGASPINVF